ncbi:MAG TPA: hypothetical protein VFJ58_16665 [Armatimonadota bacterium]|nr:hypothetical protein [Armatimonadota bacterium]
MGPRAAPPPCQFVAGDDAAIDAVYRRLVAAVRSDSDRPGRDLRRSGELQSGASGHRGTLEALAFWVRNPWDEGELHELAGLSREQRLARYDVAPRRQTAAVRAESHYARWPDARRPETVDQAARRDHFCERGDIQSAMLRDNGLVYLEGLGSRSADGRPASGT